MKNVVIQKQIWDEYGYDQFIEQLKKTFNVFEVDVIPFTDDVIPEVTEEKIDYVFGSGRLVDIARKRGWNTFKSYEPIVDNLLSHKSLWLNGESEEITIREFLEKYTSMQSVFIKPVREKLFTGLVVNCIAFVDKQFDEIIQCSTTDIDDILDEHIIVSTPQTIGTEYRFIIIDNEIITGSTYACNVYERIESDSYINTKMKAFIDTNVGLHFTGVMDICLVDDYIKVIECNNLNSAGIYKSDAGKLVEALKQTYKYDLTISRVDDTLEKLGIEPKLKYDGSDADEESLVYTFNKNSNHIISIIEIWSDGTIVILGNNIEKIDEITFDRDDLIETILKDYKNCEIQEALYSVSQGSGGKRKPPPVITNIPAIWNVGGVKLTSHIPFNENDANFINKTLRTKFL